MKPAALRFLVCPSCGSDFDLEADSSDGSEILEGRLSCHGCDASFPVRRGVPRFVTTSAYSGSFGRQWNWFRRVQIDSAHGTDESERALAGATGWTNADYAGRLVLDAGVGAGRFAEVAAKKGGEVVGIDLTDAVDAAFANVGRLPNVHIFQADIFAMPFLPETFDLAYSIGVLHHTPDTRVAFDRVASKVRKGGGLAVYLYAAYGPDRHVSDAIRKVTTRLPLPVLLALSTLAIPLYYIHRIPLLGKLLHFLFPTSMHPRWRWRWLDTFDWYTPKYQWKFFYPEIHRWFRDAGFVDIEIFDEPIRMRGVKDQGKARVSSRPAQETTAQLEPAREAPSSGVVNPSGLRAFGL
jgi:SAM-dependent methyltransferase